MDRTVVYVPYPMLHPVVDVGRLEAVAPVELVTVPYEIDHAVRTAREQDPWSAELRAAQPLLTDDQRDAFARAEVVFTLDVPMDLPPLAPRLRWVQAIGSGVGQFVSSRLPDGDITLTNGASLGAGPIAEWVMARVLQILRNLPAHDAAAAEHQWRTTYGRQLEGRTVTVVGLGAIGRAVAVRARPFGVHLVGVRRRARAGEGDPDVDELVGPDALHQVLGRSDVVVLAAPGTAENENLFDEEAFSAMAQGAIFVNVARGTLVDEAALIAHLESGHLGAAALDVARTEPLPSDDPLWDAPRVFISPHASAGGDNYGQRAFDLFCENFARYVKGEPLRNVVDLSSGY
jgi:phosphoglycerate dehydrogenase-like enzyme